MQLIIAIAAIGVAGGCAESPAPSIPQLDPATIGVFADLPGRIQISIVAANEQTDFFIERGNVQRMPVGVDAPKEATGIGLGGQLGASFLPPLPDYEYQGPYAFSRDKRQVVASIVPKSNGALMPSSLAIFNLADGRLISVVRGAPVEFIDSLSWSPDGALLAVVKKREHARFSIRGLLSSLSGHPMVKNDYLLVILRKDGAPVANSTVLSESRQGWSKVVWVE